MRRRRKSRRWRRPKLRLQLDLRKALFVLPNLFTVSSIFCGFYAIVLAIGSPTPADMNYAYIAIFFGIFFDMADGRVARLTKTQSEFGVQLDSLADLITFGVAPALLTHQWCLDQLGLGGAVVAFAYIAAGALRLARFNVLAARGGSKPSPFFLGLPIPLAGGMLVSVQMFHQHAGFERPPPVTSVVGLVLVLAYLMVSNVRYRSFKNIRATRRSLVLSVLFLGTLCTLSFAVMPAFALLAGLSSYVFLGLAEEVIFFRKRRREAEAEREQALQQPAAPDGNS